MNFERVSDYELSLTAGRFIDSLDLALEGLANRTVDAAAPQKTDFEAVRELTRQIQARVREVRRRAYALDPNPDVRRE